MKNYMFIFFLNFKRQLYIFFTLRFRLFLLVISILINPLISQENFCYKLTYGKEKIKYTKNLIYEQISSHPVLTNFPNPFHNFTYIYIRLPRPQHCKLKIYDLVGNIVKQFSLYDKQEYLILWDATNENSQRVSTGGYLCYVEYDGGILLRKIAFIKQ